MDYKNPEDFTSIEEMMDYLILTASVTVWGVDDDGELLLQTDEEMAKMWAPWYLEAQLEEQLEEVNQSLLSMQERGLVEAVGIDEDGEMIWAITDEGRRRVEDHFED